MGISLNYRKAFYAFLIIAVIILIISLCLWIIFPLVFPVLVRKNIMLTVNDGDYPSRSTFFWTKPPAKTYMRFYFFNVTNPDEVVYYGEKPTINEVGPYTMEVTEHKSEVVFQKDGEEVSYETHKRFTFSIEQSCEGCQEDDLVTVPNSVALGALSGMIDPAYKCDDTCRLIIDIGLLLLGEAPFNTVPFIQLTYHGYNDPFLLFAHSELFTALGNFFKNGSSIAPIKIPTMERMAYFFQYNNSNDENYLIKTGKDTIDNLGTIKHWANSNLLPAVWWTTVQARMINGTEAGGLSGPELKKDSVLPFFQSYMCRSFYAVYKEETTVEGIPCYRYEVPSEVYDSTEDQNIGFRYKNSEKINYFEDWNPCPDKDPDSTPNCPPDTFIDCTKKQNFCHQCCQGSKLDDTYLLPPGFFPVACYPGKNQTPPFTAFYSAPHYYYAPEVTLNTVRGMSPPVAEEHSPFVFDREPKSGTLTRMQFRLMISMPMFRNSKATISQQLPNVIIPVFWVDSTTTLDTFMYNTLHSSFVVLPLAINITKSVTLAVAIICFILALWCRFNKGFRKTRPAKPKTKSLPAANAQNPQQDTLINIEQPTVEAKAEDSAEHPESVSFVEPTINETDASAADV